MLTWQQLTLVFTFGLLNMRMRQVFFLWINNESSTCTVCSTTNYIYNWVLIIIKMRVQVSRVSLYGHHRSVFIMMVTILIVLVVIIFVSKLPINGKWYDPGQLTGYTEEEHQHKDNNSNDDAQLVEFAGGPRSSQCCGMVTPLCGTSDLQCVHKQCIIHYKYKYFGSINSKKC